MVRAILHTTWLVLMCVEAYGQTFDVASIKPADGSSDPGPGRRLQYVPGGMKIYGATLSRLIQEAYQLPEILIAGMPTWAKNDRFDVLAKASGLTDRAQLQLMLRQLLAERCHLGVHFQPKEMQFFELTVRDQSKLHPLALDASVTQKDLEAVGAFRQLNDPERMQAAGGEGSTNCQRCTVQEFAAILTNNPREIGRPVIDKSGLDGTYLFWAKYYAGELISVLNTEYGIKLVSKKGPVDTLIVDKIDRPSSN